MNRLIRAMQWQACLSTGEAESCIRDYRAGRLWSGEAVNHYGGTVAVLVDSIHNRRHSRRWSDFHPTVSRLPKREDYDSDLEFERWRWADR